MIVLCPSQDALPVEIRNRSDNGRKGPRGHAKQEAAVLRRQIRSCLRIRYMTFRIRTHGIFKLMERGTGLCGCGERRTSSRGFEVRMRAHISFLARTGSHAFGQWTLLLTGIAPSLTSKPRTLFIVMVIAAAHRLLLISANPDKQAQRYSTVWLLH